MTAFACALEAAGGRVIGLAPSAAAAAVLGAELEVPADTLHKLLDVHARAKAVAGPNGRVPDGAIEPRYALDARSVLLVDEAGMAGTPELAAVLELAERYGASIRLLGDPSQLAAVGSGGALRLIDHYVGAAHLEEVRRFLLADGKTTNEKEARASLQLRKGNPVGLDYYVENDRARGGTREAMIEDVYAAWATDMAAGDSAIMVAATNDVVVELNARARRDRVIAGRVKEDGVFLHDGGTAGVGDIVVSRRNDRRLRTGPSDFVKNGDLWRVTRHYHDGALSVVHRDTKASVTLPAGYVAEWIELGYAATVHRVQGMTVDAGHLLVDETMTRDHLYTGATRGRYMNRMYVVTDAVLDVDLHEQPDPARAVRQTLEQVLDRTEGDPAALEALVTEWDSAHSLAQLVPAYEDAHTRLLEPDREQRIATLLHEQIPAHADRILTDPAWPALLARLARHENSGSDLRQLLPNALAEREIGTADSLAQVLHWRIGDPEPEPGESNLPSWVTPAPQEDPEPTQDPAPQPQVEADPAEDETLADQKIPDVRVDPGEPAYREAVEINTAAWTWWNQQSDSSDSWTATYLNARGVPTAESGWAPNGWDGLVGHLRSLGYRDDALLDSGVATRTRDGRLIDRFRDRLVMPIRDPEGLIVGFTARANPDVADARTPKYLNTPETAAFHKRELLHGWSPTAAARLAAGARAVFVEGPLDVAAVASLHRDDLVPLAPCGTALTDAQLDLIRRAGGDLARAIFLFDADTSGRRATVRAWERLTPTEAHTARGAVMVGAKDPGELIQTGRGEDLDAALRHAGHLTHDVIDHFVGTTPTDTPEKAVALARRLGDALTRLPDDPETDVYLAGALTGRLDPQTVYDILANLRSPIGADTIVVTDDGDPTSSTRRVVDPAVRDWLERQAILISDRLDALVADIEGDTPPAWARSLYRPPADARTLAVWRARVRDVAAYRDRYAITGTDPLGPVPPHDVGAQTYAYETAKTALKKLIPTQPPPAPTAEQADQLDTLRRRLELARVQAVRATEESPQPEMTTPDPHMPGIPKPGM